MSRKWIPRLLAAGAIMSLTSFGPVMAQDTGAAGTETITTTTTEEDRGGLDLGWLGLLGLAGLLGLRRPAPTVIHRDPVARP